MASATRGRRDWKLILAASGIIGSALLLAGCNRHAGGVHSIGMFFEVSPSPPRLGLTKLTLSLAGQHGTPLTGAHLKLEGDMSHPGMAPVFGDVTETKPGHYEGSLNFGMAGDWVVVVRGTLADGERLEREVRIPGVRPD